MIRLTGEMLQVAHKALAPKGDMPTGLVTALTEVLALVERDYLTLILPPLAATTEQGQCA
jgi:hypothetical protein